MVVREYAQCAVCNTGLILRIGIGLEASCHHTFDCPSCHTPISVEAKTGTPPAAWIEAKENISLTPQTDAEAVIVNLHPSFAFRLDDYHWPYAFASMQSVKMISPFARVPKDARVADIATDFEVPNTQQVWPVVRSVLTLTTKGDPASVLAQQISKYESLRREYKSGFKCQTAFKCVASFFDDIFYPAIGRLRSPLRAFTAAQRMNHGPEFDNFLAFYERDLQQQSLDRSISTFTDYFRYFDQFREVLAHARVGEDGVDTLVVGSKRFDEIKLYYGQAYEALTSAYTILACLFNISQGVHSTRFSQCPSGSTSRTLRSPSAHWSIPRSA